MQILLVSYSFMRGGVGIAARKFGQLASRIGTVEGVCADGSQVDDFVVHAPGRLARAFHFLQRVVSLLLLFFVRKDVEVKRSLNLFSSSFVLHAMQNYDHSWIRHVHWINNDALSVAQLSRLPEHSIITLHDEWLYCAAEHYYAPSNKEQWFVQGYPVRRRFGFLPDLGHWLWSQKVRRLASRNDLIITVPSRWIQARAQASAVLRGKDIRLLPNPIDTNSFRRLDDSERSRRRSALSIGEDDVVIGFGAVGGKANYFKGSYLLLQAFEILQDRLRDSEKTQIRILLFGGDQRTTNFQGFPAIDLGYLNSPAKLVGAYSISDLMIVPSLAESFGQVAAESLACETPVIAFNASGITDIVHDNENGYLAEPFRADDLAEKILMGIRAGSAARRELGSRGRQHVTEAFSYEVILPRYREILEVAKSRTLSARGETAITN